MTIKAIPLSAGVALKKMESASRPPAEAPIPTTGKARLARCSDPTGAAGSVWESAVAAFSAGVGLSLFKDPPCPPADEGAKAQLRWTSTIDGMPRCGERFAQELIMRAIPAALPL